MAAGTTACTASKASAVGPRHQQRLPAGHDPFGDCRDLLGRLAQTEDDLGKALTQRPLMVDPGKAQVFDRLGAHFRGDVHGGLGGAKLAGGHTIEQGFEVENHEAGVTTWYG